METPPERNCPSLYPLGCFPILFPLLQLMGCSFFSRDSFTFVKKIVEKIRAERDGDSHRVCTEHTRTLTTHTSTPIPKFPLITRLHKRKMDDDYLSFVFFFFQEFDFLQHMIGAQKNDGIYTVTSHTRCTTLALKVLFRAPPLEV